MNEKNGMSALIAARPGPLQEGLRALLRILPQIGVIDQAYDLASAHSAIAEGHPNLVLVDIGLADQSTFSMVKEIKMAGGRNHYVLVLVDTVQQQQEAESAGADIVLPRGFPAAKLLAVIEDLVNPKNTPGRESIGEEGKGLNSVL